jgi:hypothetical protein
MARFVLCRFATDRPIAIAEGSEARVYALAHTSPKYSSKFMTVEEFERGHVALKDSYRRRYISEGKSLEQAERLSEIAAGASPLAGLPTVNLGEPGIAPAAPPTSKLNAHESAGLIALRESFAQRYRNEGFTDAEAARRADIAAKGRRP